MVVAALNAMPWLQVWVGSTVAMFVAGGMWVGAQRALTANNKPSTLNPVWKEATVAYMKWQVRPFFFACALLTRRSPRRRRNR